LVRLIELIVRAIFKILKFFGLWVPVCYIIFGFVLSAKYGFSPFESDFFSRLFWGGFIGSVICSIIITFRSIFITPFKSKRELNKTKEELKKFIESENLREREFHIKRQESLAEKEKSLARKEWELNQKMKKISKKRTRAEKRFLRAPQEQEIDFGYLDKKTVPAPEVEAPLTISMKKTKNKAPFVGSDKMATYRKPLMPQEIAEQEGKPAIYNSAIDPNLLIHEYKDRFVVYREEGSRVKLEKVEYK